MSKVYDSWERLVEAVLKREQFKQLALCESFSSSISADFSSRFSFSSSLQDFPGSRIYSDRGAPSGTNGISYREVQPIEFEEIKKTMRYSRRYWIPQEGYLPIRRGWIDEHTLTAPMPGHGTTVAIKKWGQDNRAKWMSEIHYLRWLHHPNLVRLIGYCDKAENLISLYEFIPRGSLDNHLFKRCHQSLSWEIRIKVAKDVARCLSFLHEMEIPIIHGDVTSRAVLLDREYNAKLSNFGLARDGPNGDMTLEDIATDHLTVKYDVYKFGIILLELLCGLQAFRANRVRWPRHQVEWAEPTLDNKRKVLQIMDDKLEGKYPHQAAYSVATLALRCLKFDPKQRPQMAEVFVALEEL